MLPDALAVGPQRHEFDEVHTWGSGELVRGYDIDRRGTAANLSFVDMFDLAIRHDLFRRPVSGP